MADVEKVVMTTPLIGFLYYLVKQTIGILNIEPYYPQLLTCIGGAAYELYSQQLHTQSIPTHDCDMALWPYLNMNVPYDITQQLEQISNGIKENIEKVYKFHSVLHTQIKQAVGSDEINFDIQMVRFPSFSPKRYIPIRNMNIKINIIGKKRIMIELVVHNAINGQEYLINHTQVDQFHTAMIHDPMYCNNFYKIGTTIVPNLSDFIKQQFFAFTNLFLASDERYVKGIQRIDALFQGIEPSMKDTISTHMDQMIHGVIYNLRGHIQNMYKTEIEKGIPSLLQYKLNASVPPEVLKRSMILQQKVEIHRITKEKSHIIKPLVKYLKGLQNFYNNFSQDGFLTKNHTLNDISKYIDTGNKIMKIMEDDTIKANSKVNISVIKEITMDILSRLENIRSQSGGKRRKNRMTKRHTKRHRSKTRRSIR